MKSATASRNLQQLMAQSEEIMRCTHAHCADYMNFTMELLLLKYCPSRQMETAQVLIWRKSVQKSWLEK